MLRNLSAAVAVLALSTVAWADASLPAAAAPGPPPIACGDPAWPAVRRALAEACPVPDRRPAVSFGMIDASDPTQIRATRRSCRRFREAFASCKSAPALEPGDEKDVYVARVSDDRWDGDFTATFTRRGRRFEMSGISFTYLGCH
jgi:hypothetical protein